MPGFIIETGGPGTVDAVGKDTDWLRNHRFTLLDFFGQLPPTTQKEFLMLKDVTLPDKTISELSIKTPGTTYKFAKQATYSDLKLTFYGSTTLLTKCLQLADQPHSLGGGIKDHNDYKGQISFMINNTGGPIDGLGSTGNASRAQQQTAAGAVGGFFGAIAAAAIALQAKPQTGIKYDYSGAWVSNVNHGQLTYSSSDIKLITVNVKFDFFEVTSGRISGGTNIVKNTDKDPDSILDKAYNGKI